MSLLSAGIKRLDDTLYLAKDAGRNCVAIADDELKYSLTPINLDWDDGWASGNPEIDQQHQTLLNFANDLISATASGGTYRNSNDDLGLFIDNLQQHFDDEIRILKALGYPDYESHARIHQELAEKALRFKELYETEEILSTTFISYIIDEVVIGHMLKDDFMFYPYTRQDTEIKVLRGANKGELKL